MKVLYAGDAAALLGPIFIASPVNMEVKGFSRPGHGLRQRLLPALGRPLPALAVLQELLAAGHKVAGRAGLRR